MKFRIGDIVRAVDVGGWNYRHVCPEGTLVQITRGVNGAGCIAGVIVSTGERVTGFAKRFVLAHRRKPEPMHTETLL